MKSNARSLKLAATLARIRRSGRGSEPRGKSLHRVGQQGLGRTQQATRLTAGADGHADHIHGQIAQALGDIATLERLVRTEEWHKPQ